MSTVIQLSDQYTIEPNRLLKQALIYCEQGKEEKGVKETGKDRDRETEAELLIIAIL